MGNQSSTHIDDDTPTQTLESRDLKSVAKLIKDGRVTRIVVMTGAGISTAAGIPDFRSPETGLYHNLARLNLPFAEAVFEIDYFKVHPEPFYVLARELYPGNFHPTLAHTFIALLAKKKLLRMLFTQNIDCLERAAGVPGDLIVEAHGSFATQRCVECKTDYPDKEMREHVEAGKPPKCITGCGGLVKPDIVFFGEQLPAAFHDNRTVPCTSDLMLVLGTSLTVHPFAGLPMMAMEGVPRVLFNKEQVGDMGTRADDVICLGDCDAGIRELAKELGWEEELEGTWRAIVGDEEAERQIAHIAQSREKDEVERLAAEVEDRLELSDDSDSNNGANRSGQVGEQEAKTSTEQEKEDREEGAEAEETAAAASEDLSLGAATKGEENIHQHSETATQAEQIGQAHTTESAGVDGESGIEKSHELATFSKPVVNQTDTDKSRWEKKHGKSISKSSDEDQSGPKI